MPINPRFTHNPTVAIAALSVANSNLDGTGTLATLLTGKSQTGSSPGSGTQVVRISIKATGNTTAGMIRFFIADKLWHEEPVTAETPGASTEAFSAVLAYPTITTPLNLGDGQTLKCSTENAETFEVMAETGEF